MSNVALCPNCGGQKTISKPPYIAGDVNRWVSSSMETFPCPTCEGRGWIRVDSVPQEDFAAMKGVALLSMETAENLMDECTKRADRIKELEAELERAEGQSRAVKEMRDEVLGDWEVKRGAVARLEDEVSNLLTLVDVKDMRISDIISRRDVERKTRIRRERELIDIINDLTISAQT